MISAALRVNRRVDAHQPAFGVHKGAAGVARIDRRVGLNEILVLVDLERAPSQRADNPHRHRLPYIERVADRQHNVADFQFVAVGDRDRRQVGRRDFQHGNIGRRIGANHLRGELLPACGQGHLDFVGPFDDDAFADTRVA